ncbi:MAG: DUF6427 family protein [Bacteroidota bacterium]
MIADFFNKTKPINFLILNIFSILVYFTAVIINFSDENYTSSFIYISFYLFFFLLFLFIHNFITRKNKLTSDNSYALLIFILLFALFPKTFANYKILISNFFLFFAIRRIYSLRSLFETKSKLFDSAFWIGLATLFYSWSIAYLILIYVAIIVFRKIKWNYFIIPIIGFITPIYLYYVYLLIVNKEQLFSKIWSFSFGFDYTNYNDLNLLLPIAIILVFIMWSIYPTLKKSLKAKKYKKVTYTLLLIHLFLALILAIISPIKDGSEFIFLFFPFSILFTKYLQTVKDYWFKEAILIMFLILSIVVTFLY